ncbi:unnamed protein product [Rotaria sp. Silwood2]|nr:unnamed protein product [Rotaria sp. Silwood2]CAF3362956.1 unnamed protein product [Rotaria sp. Silwood2]CAF4231203.1 unnamed protein product [Rotaria sp. Silwood2]CAF4367973.1 unnamed protein product [Rotaria sp. Silwood2]
MCIDFLNTTHLNYGNTVVGQSSSTAGVGTGVFTIPVLGPTIVRAIQFTIGGDALNRDPFTITLEGSNTTDSALSVGFSWTLLYSGEAGFNSDSNSVIRYYLGQKQNFTNNLAFTAYCILVTSQRSSDDCTQFSEMHLFSLI